MIQKINKSGIGICNFCISNPDYRYDLDEREKEYLLNVIENRTRKYTYDLDKYYPCSLNGCEKKYQRRRVADDPNHKVCNKCFKILNKEKIKKEENIIKNENYDT